MTVTAVRLAGRPGLPLLVLGPSLGTSAAALWSPVAAELGDAFQVVGWDLPGHGHNRWVPEDGVPLTLGDLARAVLDVVDAMGDGFDPVPFHYAGVSVGGAVGLELALAAPDRVLSATLLGTGARLGTPESWAERVAAVREAGTAGLVDSAVERWFAPGAREREAGRVDALLDALAGADDAGYVAVCGALATFDARDRLARVRVPVLAVAGALDPVTPTASLEELAHGVADGRLVVLPDVAHLAPVEAPGAVARLVREHALGPSDPPGEDAQGLDPRTRSLVDLALALVRGGGSDGGEQVEKAVDGALRHGATVDEVRAVLLRVADGPTNPTPAG